MEAGRSRPENKQLFRGKRGKQRSEGSAFRSVRERGNDASQITNLIVRLLISLQETLHTLQRVSKLSFPLLFLFLPTTSRLLEQSSNLAAPVSASSSNSSTRSRAPRTLQKRLPTIPQPNDRLPCPLSVSVLASIHPQPFPRHRFGEVASFLQVLDEARQGLVGAQRPCAGGRRRGANEGES